MKDGYREKVRVATKQPCFLVNSYARFRPASQRAIEKATDRKNDFYLLHGLNNVEWPKVRNLGVLNWAEGAMADGRIGYLGFSFHDTMKFFRK